MPDTPSELRIGRPTLDDVARAAGVSLATADRVLNNRPGVRARTAAQVTAAVQRLGYRPDPLAARLSRGRSLRFAFVLPEGGNPFMDTINEQVRRTADWLRSQRASVEIVHADVFDAAALAHRLETLPPHIDGVATVALDHPVVRHAIDALADRGTPVVTLVSDAPASRRLRFAGIDNLAAGRTAGSLLGRFAAGRTGGVGVLAGSLLLRDHAERVLGFSQVLADDYPGLTLLPVAESRDQDERAAAATADLLAQHPDLVGLYSAGAGTEGLGAAVEGSGRAGGLVVIGHELTPASRRLILRGTMAACIAQDAGHEARSAARLLLAELDGEPILPEQERIRIEIYVRDNLP